MGFKPGQFAGISKEQIPGAKYPFINEQPPGAYKLQVIELRGFETRKKDVAFAADFTVIEGPEGASPKVSLLTTRKSDYYLKDIKSVANAVLGGFVPDAETGELRPLVAEDIDEEMMENLCGDDNPSAGCVVVCTVVRKPKKDKPTELVGLAFFEPLPPEPTTSA